MAFPNALLIPTLMAGEVMGLFRSCSLVPSEIFVQIFQHVLRQS